MGSFTKEAKAFGKEFARQGSILLFGKAPKPKRRKPPKRVYGAEHQYTKPNVGQNSMASNKKARPGSSGQGSEVISSAHACHGSGEIPRARFVRSGS